LAYLEIERRSQGYEIVAAAEGVRCAILDAFTGPKGKALKMLADHLMSGGKSDGATANDSTEMNRLRERLKSMGVNVKEKK